MRSNPVICQQLEEKKLADIYVIPFAKQSDPLRHNWLLQFSQVLIHSGAKPFFLLVRALLIHIGIAHPLVFRKKKKTTYTFVVLRGE